MEQFRNIGLIGRMGNDHVIETLNEIILFLRNEGYHTILEKETSEALHKHGLQVCARNMLGEVCDLVIVVGGDGSMLNAARALARHGVPIIGINRGRLGFLADISPDSFELQLKNVLAGSYVEETRFLLGCYVHRENNVVNKSEAFNDVVLSRGKSTRLISFDLYIDGQFVYTQRSDGLIISTPTGSTAYSLSSGGPIMHPKLDAVVLVPMCPHTLTSRPIVIDANKEIKIVVDSCSDAFPQLSCDGGYLMTPEPGDVIYIRKKTHQVKLIHPKEYDYYNVCRTKLGWGSEL